METILRKDYYRVLKTDNRFPLISSIVLLVATLVMFGLSAWSSIFLEAVIQIVFFGGLSIHVLTRVVFWAWPYVGETIEKVLDRD